MPDHIKASIERLFHKIPAMKFSLICMLSFPNIYHFTVNIHCTHYLPGAPLTVGSGAFIFIQQTGFAEICFSIIFLPSHRKNLYLEQSPQIRPTENKRLQTAQLNSNLTDYKNPRIEIQAKFNLSIVL